jgi:hypothetical protein
MPNTYNPTNFGSEEKHKMDIGISSMNFVELLKVCSIDSIYVPPSGVVE